MLYTLWIFGQRGKLGQDLKAVLKTTCYDVSNCVVDFMTQDDGI